MNITKILLSVITAIMIVTNTNATTMCVTNDNNSIILDPSVEGTSYTSQASSKTWITTFPNYTVNGIATCNSTTASYEAHPEYNFDNNYVSSEGTECWCKMTSPVRSAWVFDYGFSSASDCVSQCANYCGSGVRYYSDVRERFFGSAGM